MSSGSPLLVPSAAAETAPVSSTPRNTPMEARNLSFPLTGARFGSRWLRRFGFMD
jgi:hypothetical protein